MGLKEMVILSSMDGNTNLTEDWWTEWQTELAQDKSRVWIKTKFQKRAGYWVNVEGGRFLGRVEDNEPLPPDAGLELNAWDHEHCELCFQKISEYPGDQAEGYFNGSHWICVECFNKYIVPRENTPDLP
ncbi:MAG: hypothetical protein Q8927_19220 [Bacteroidota bacterium]|nr:hypothetical protein [Bacteroidota bacterium]MDP4218336.1 hypothetical protein [Bacteroidota bacterium]MDP4255556.1 hypothetical protein [Bacteroidota bacterium]MDP4259676.1 hypothetical protein [Bacteroidota bacterium]